jgi:hypothetical protein
MQGWHAFQNPEVCKLSATNMGMKDVCQQLMRLLLFNVTYGEQYANSWLSMYTQKA